MAERPFRFWNRGGTIYYRLAGGVWKSTGKKTEAEAMDVVLALLREQGKSIGAHVARLSLGEYAAPFFLWDRCPHCLRVRASGGQLGPEHVASQRSVLERFLIGNKDHKPDPLASTPIVKIKRGDCIDFRARLIRKLGVSIDNREDPAGKRTVNLAMTALSTIFSEGCERGELEYNPAARLAIKYVKRERGIFTPAEMKKMFPADVEELGPWEDFQTKTMFLLAGTCGLRRNEVRALRWEHVDLASRTVRVFEAFKGQRRPGRPKWDKLRQTRLPNITARHLAHRHELCAEASPEDLVFQHPDGSPIGTQLWEESWNRAMKKLEVYRVGRKLVPHSLRHTVATELAAGGLSDALIQAGLGWTNPKTQKGYTHLQPEHMDNQARIIDGLFG
jgi:integrase